MTSTQNGKTSKKTAWYIHAKDAHSNEVVASALQLGQVASEFSLMECADGIKRHLYEVEGYSVASRFYKSQKDLKASFEIFRSQNDGLPGEWKFPVKKKISLKKITERSSVIKLGATMSLHRKR